MNGINKIFESKLVNIIMNLSQVTTTSCGPVKNNCTIITQFQPLFLLCLINNVDISN